MISASLIESASHLLAQEAPRYTSYPSAQYFGPLGPESAGAWLGALDSARSVGLYIHVPFCEEMCWFCGCHTKATHRRLPVSGYVDTLLQEIDLVAGRLCGRPRLHAIHFGGGSPTILQPADLDRLFDRIDRVFDRNAATEISIEIDPRRLTEDLADAYAAHDVSRASLGVQDSDPAVMAAIGRPQPFDCVRRAADMLRSRSIAALNVDIMYGLPEQTPATLDRTLRHIAELGPDRIACFSYAHLPHLKKHQRLIDEGALPSPEDKAMAYLQIANRLGGFGYAAIGIDHFAQAHDTLFACLVNRTLRRNFQGYSTLPNDLLIGLGASAISEAEQGLAQNAASTHAWRHAIAGGKLATVRGWRMTREDRLRHDVIEALMCYFTADVGAIAAAHSYPPDYLDPEIEALAPYRRDGVVSVSGRTVRFHSPLRMLVRTVAATFDAFARANPAQRYSKVA